MNNEPNRNQDYPLKSKDEWEDKFNPYDLYTKSPVPPDVNKLHLYNEDLASKYLPDVLKY